MIKFFFFHMIKTLISFLYTQFSNMNLLFVNNVYHDLYIITMVSIIDLKNNKFKLKEYCFNHEGHIKNFKYVVSLTLLILSQNKTREYYYFF